MMKDEYFDFDTTHYQNRHQSLVTPLPMCGDAVTSMW